MFFGLGRVFSDVKNELQFCRRDISQYGQELKELRETLTDHTKQLSAHDARAVANNEAIVTRFQLLEKRIERIL